MINLRGNGGGIISRANTTEAKWYFFAIQPDGYYDLYVSQWHRSGNNIVTTLHGDYNSAIYPKTNKLVVIAKNNDIYLLVNGQYLYQQVSNTYGSGNIGLLVADTPYLTDIAFTNVEIWSNKS